MALFAVTIPWLALKSKGKKQKTDERVRNWYSIEEGDYGASRYAQHLPGFFSHRLVEL